MSKHKPCSQCGEPIVLKKNNFGKYKPFNAGSENQLHACDPEERYNYANKIDSNGDQRLEMERLGLVSWYTEKNLPVPEIYKTLSAYRSEQKRRNAMTGKESFAALKPETKAMIEQFLKTKKGPARDAIAAMIENLDVPF